MGRLTGYLAICILFAAALPTSAGGAWPRGKGQFFGSVSWSNWGDVLGYLDAIQGPLLEEPELLMTDEIGLYLEYGVSDRITLGFDHYDQPDTGIGAAVIFLRSGLGSLDWNDKFALELGIGQISDQFGNTDDLVRAGLSWGRGFTSRWTDGWVDVDARYASVSSGEATFWKTDVTLGIKPQETHLWYLQLQSGALDDYPTYLRAVPTYVRRLGHGFSVESAVLWGIENDNSQGVKLGLWLEF